MEIIENQMAKQILILGINCSDTSTLAMHINHLGIYSGNGLHEIKDGEPTPDADNEMQGVQQLNNFLLNAAGGSWSHLVKIDLSAIEKNTLNFFYEKAQSIISSLNEHSSWAIKDPLLCLVLPIWMKLLEKPICIIVWRDPLATARSLQKRENFFINQGISLWEYYNLVAIKNSIGCPRLLISYTDLMSNPQKITQEIVYFLSEQGIVELDNLNAAKQSRVLDSTRQRHKSVSSSTLQSILNEPQLTLLQALKNKTALNWELIPNISDGGRQGLKELEQLGNVKESICILEEMANQSSSLLNSVQYKFSKVVFTIYRKLIGKRGESLTLFAERNLNELLLHFSSLKLKQLQEKNINTGSKIPVSFSVKPQSLIKWKKDDISTDVVICVHNALDDVRAALTSIVKTRTQFSRLIIVNDGSNLSTTDFLYSFASRKAWCTLLNNSTPRGYTKAANQGMLHSTAPFVILVNSDVLVPKEWLQLLKRCAYSSDQIGMVGPLSNAATWQSIPKRQDESGKWLINTLPSGWTVDKMQSLVANISERRYPRVHLLNGFCLGIKRTVLEKIGYLDEKAFPQGYGEENDFCIRAIKSGFELAITDDLFIYHGKSKSFGSVQREKLTKQGGKALKRKYGRTFAKKYTKELIEDTTIARLRRRTTTAFHWNISFNQPLKCCAKIFKFS